MTADRSAAADTLRDELAAGLKEAWDNVTGFTFKLRHWENVLVEPAARAALDRYADAQVAAERNRCERICHETIEATMTRAGVNAVKYVVDRIARGQP